MSVFKFCSTCGAPIVFKKEWVTSYHSVTGKPQVIQKWGCSKKRWWMWDYHSEEEREKEERRWVKPRVPSQKKLDLKNALKAKL